MGRPVSVFRGFVGQSQLVRALLGHLHGAQRQGKAFPHMLLWGTSGIGKTELAEAVAAEYGTSIVEARGKIPPIEICEKAIAMKSGEFLFFDEGHLLARDSHELLYELIDKSRIADRFCGKLTGTKDEAGRFIVAPVTLILATDQPSELPRALHRRMKLTFRLAYYSDIELASIATGQATRLGATVTPQAMHAVARAAQGLPSRALDLVEGLYRCSSGNGEFGIDHVRSYLKQMGLDSEGISRDQQRYLFRLRKLGSASRETMAEEFGGDAGMVKDAIEFGLKKLGYMRITRIGRCLTPAGRDWVRKRAMEIKARKQKK